MVTIIRVRARVVGPDGVERTIQPRIQAPPGASNEELRRIHAEAYDFVKYHKLLPKYGLLYSWIYANQSMFYGSQPVKLKEVYWVDVDYYSGFIPPQRIGYETPHAETETAQELTKEDVERIAEWYREIKIREERKKRRRKKRGKT